MRIVKAEWAPSPPIRSDAEVDLVRELMSYHCRCATSNQLSINPESGEVEEITKNSALGWSRVFEWPWTLLNGDFHSWCSCLDVGGGHGVLQYALAKRCGRVVNVDLEPKHEAINWMNQILGVNIAVASGDASQRLPFPDGSFDRVVCISVLEHVPGWKWATAELIRLVKPKGILILTVDVEVKEKTGGEFRIGLGEARKFVTERWDGEILNEQGPVLVNIMPDGSELACLCLKLVKE